MAGTASSSPSPVAIGNCKVVIEGHGVCCESSEKRLLISVASDTKINISVDDTKVYVRRKYCNYSRSKFKNQNDGETAFSPTMNSFLLLNPKDVDSGSKSLLQEALKLYTEELPRMNYAANTGKKSQFLEKCILGGKYRTLIIKYPSEKQGEVIAAISYQIIPSDTQYAEIPLAAVGEKHQNMGVGENLYKELRERLQNVGIITIFCWADQKSEGFWLKQGFISVGVVDRKGKAGKLPIKADIRRALSFPGGSMLMVAHVKKETSSGNSLQHIKLFPSKPVKLSSDIDCNSNGNDLKDVAEGFDADVNHHSSEQGLKRPIWEASLSSLKSKRVRGAHLISCCKDLNEDLSCDSSSKSSGCKDVAEMLPHYINPRNLGICNTGHLSGEISDNLDSKGNCPRIMFMDIADDVKKTWLTKIVEELGGSVTSDGSVSTHVITGKARKTLNFCLALCSGAWIVTPNWLKSSFREGRFLEESQFILDYQDFFSKYKTNLREVVGRAKMDPHSLLRGYHVCLAKHIQPSVVILSAIVRSAGGNVMKNLGCIEEPSKTIFVACEEDISEALSAAKEGVWTFSSDWLMNCVMKQELDLEAPQFAESL